MLRRSLRLLLCTALLAAPAAAQTDADFFGDDSLGEVRLFVNSRDWQTLRERYDENTYYPADLHWNGLVVRNVGIRSQGRGSRTGTKPGLRVDFDRYSSSQRFLGLKSAVLDNLNTDASGIRERVAMRFFQRLGMPAPRERHVKLFVNHEYAGLYALVESIDKAFLARVFGGPEGQVENDGHLYEFKHRFYFDFGYLGPDLDPYAVLFEPRTREHDAPADLYGPLEELFRTVVEDAPAGFTHAITSFLDPALFVRLVAIETFLAEFDGLLGHWGANNFYLYRFERGRRFQILPWDKDQAFRRANLPIGWRLEENALMRRLMQVDEWRALYLATLTEAAHSAAEPVAAANEEPDYDRPPRGWLEAEVEREAARVREAAKSDPARWQASGLFDDEVDRLLEFAATRSAFVLCEVAHASDPSIPGECTAPDRTAFLAPE